MAIDNLKNIEEIKSDVGRVRGQRLLEKDRLLVDIPGIEGIDGSAGLIKLFVYDVDSDEILGQSIYLGDLNDGIDIAQDLIDLGFTSGKYRVVYNIVEEKLGTYETRNYIVADPDLNEIYADAGGNWDNNWIEGSWAGDGEYIGGGALWKGTYHVDNKGDLFTFTLDSDLSKPLYPIYNKCFIQEISPSRKEIRILPVNNNTNFIENIGVYSDGFDDDSINTSFGSFVSNTADNPQELKYLADFGDNFTPLIVNWEVDEIAYPEAPHSIVLRLYEPLSDNIKKHTQLTIVKELIEPIIEEVIISGQSVSIAGRDLGELISYEDSDTGWVDSSYGDLLTSNTYGQKDLEDLYSSGSDSAELNIDYSDYSNFINFSSAQTRLDNFRYKLQQIETYESKSLVAQQRRESLYVELVDNGDFSGNSANWEHYGINWTELAMPDTAILYHNDSYLQQEINSSENTTHKLKFKYKSNQQGIDNSAQFTASISGSSETIERHFTLDSLNYKTYETEFISPEDNFYIRFDTQDPWTSSWCILDYVSVAKQACGLSATHLDNEITALDRSRRKILNEFDGYEKHLYYGSNDYDLLEGAGGWPQGNVDKNASGERPWPFLKYYENGQYVFKTVSGSNQHSGQYAFKMGADNANTTAIAISTRLEDSLSVISSCEEGDTLHFSFWAKSSGSTAEYPISASAKFLGHLEDKSFGSIINSGDYVYPMGIKTDISSGDWVFCTGSSTVISSNHKYFGMTIEVYDNSVYTGMSYFHRGLNGRNYMIVDDIQVWKNNMFGTTWPKKTVGNVMSSSFSSSIGHPTLYSVGWPEETNEASLFYTSQSVSASLFDSNNQNRLVNILPEYLTVDSSNDDFLQFIDMIGHHFDIIWNYINEMNQVYSREQDLSKGISKDLVYYIGQAFGWDFSHGESLDDLLKYNFGVELSGSEELVTNGDFSGNSANWEHYGINWTELAMPDTAILYHNDSYLQQEINSSENTTHKLKFKYKSNQQGIDNSAQFTASISGSSETIERHFTLDSLNYKTYETEFISPEDNFYIRFDTQDPWTSSWCILDYVSITKPSAPPDISYSRPTEEITKEIWRRIVNNLPYLYKTKGTLRGVKALLNCYGIPQNLLNITTDVSLDIVGSPRGGSSYDDWRQSYKRDRRFLYALDFEGGQFVTSSWEDDTQSEVATSRKPESIEFRFRTTHQTGSQTLLGTDDDLWGINLEQSASSDYGYVNFVLSGSDGYISSSTSKLSLYDGDFRSVLLKRSSGSDSNEIDQTYELVVKKFKNNQFTEAVSSSLAVSGSTGAVSQSYNTSFTTDTNFYIGGSGSFSASFSASLSASLSESVWETFPGTSQFGSFFQGSIQEFRLWNYDLSDLVFDNHVASPESYNADTISGSYDNLVLQYKFYTKTNHSSSFDVADGKPDQTYTNTGNANNYYVLTPPHYSGYSIEHQSLVPNFGYRRVTEGVTVIPNKSDYVKSYTLDTKRSSLKAAKDLYPKQTKTIDMSLKINAGVEKDMNNFLGALPSLDNYYSSENPMYADRYEKLDTLKDAYFKKHTSPKDTWKNIKLFMLLNRGLVEQIRNYMLPARSKLKSGLSIETHKLHRSKYTYKRPTIENPTYTSSIDTQPTVDGSFRYFTGSIDKTTISEGSGEYKYYHGSSSIQNDVTGTYDYYSGSEDTKPDATGTYNYYSGSEDTKPDAVGTYNYYSGSEDTKPNITGSYDYYSGSEDTKPDATGTYDYYSGSEDTKPNITGSYDYYSGSYDSITQNASTYQYTELHWNGSGYVVVSGSDDKTMAVMPFISGGRINNDYDLFSSQSNLTQNDYPTLLENYIPSDYQKPYSTAIQNLFYGGCVNTSASTWGIDDNIGEEPFGSWDTSDNVMKINESGKLVVK